MKNKLFKLLILSIGAITSISLINLSEKSVLAESMDFIQIEPLPKNLKRGDFFNVPKAKFGDKDASCYVYTPDKKVLTTNIVKCEQQGFYTLKYFVKNNGKYLSNEVSISVSNPAYYFDDEKSNAEMNYNNQTNREGLLAKVYKNSTFHVNQIIDLNDCNSANPALDFTMIQNIANQNDAQIINVRFTDIYDSTNFVDYWINIGYGNEASPWHYARCRANEQTFKGREGTTKLHVNAYGTPFTYTATDSFDNPDLDISDSDLFSKNHICLWIDQNTNEAYIKYYHYKAHSDYSNLVIDLDDFSYQEKDFTGFTTGEVYATISFDDYISEYANLLLLNAGGIDLTKISLEDNNYPTIDLNLLGYDEDSLPKATIGKTYPVFDCSAFDKESGGQIDYSVNAYYNYTRKTGIYHEKGGKYSYEMPILDGCFETKKSGSYSLVYRSTDYSGNYTEKVLEVISSDETHNITNISMNNDYVFLGETNDIVKINTIKSVVGGINPIKNTYSVKFNNKEYPLLGNEVDGYYFKPTQAGEYYVTSTATDMLGNKKNHLDIYNISNQTSPSFVEEPVMPKYLFDDENIMFPDAIGYDSSVGKNVLANINVTDGNGFNSNVQGKKVTISSKGSSFAKIEYVLGSKKLTYQIPIIKVKNDDGDIVLDKYFNANNGLSINLTEDNIEFNGNSDSKIDFINDLIANNLTLNLSIDDLGKNYNTFFVDVVDSKTKSQEVKFSFEKDENSSINVVYDGKVVIKNLFKSSIATKNVEISFDNLNNFVYVNKTQRFRLNKNVFNTKFEGFSSNKIYVSFGAENVLTDYTINLNKINNQAFNSNISADKVVPDIFYEEDYGTLYRNYGEKVHVINAFADDVLSPYTSITVTVEDPDGNIVKTTDGIALNKAIFRADSDFNFVLNKVSSTNGNGYLITYEAKDWNNRGKSDPYLIVVANPEKPQITLNGTVPSSGEIGWINLPSFTVSGNNVSTSYISIVKPDFSVEILDQGVTRFYAFDKGIYTVIYYARDKQGNTSTLVYKIVIE